MSKVDWVKVRTVTLGIIAGTVATLGILAVTVAGFALSYDAIRAVGIAARIRVDWAWLLPVSVDGAMAVATIAAVVLHRMTGKTPWYPWLVVGVGAAISVACNGLHAIPPAGQEMHIDDWRIRFAVSAIPAVMLALSVHLLVMLVEAMAEMGTRTGNTLPVPVSGIPDTDATDVDVRDASVDPWSFAEPVRDASAPLRADASLGDPFDAPVMRHPMPEVTRHDAPALANGDARLTYPAVTHPVRRTLTEQIKKSDASPGDGSDGAEVTRQPEPVKTRRGPKPGKDDRLAEALRLVDLEGMSARAAAHQVGLNEQQVQRYVRRHRTNGHAAGGHDA